MNGGPPADNPTFADGITYNAGNINISSLISGGQITAIQSVANSGGVSEPSNSGRGYTLTFNSGGTFTLVKNGVGGGAARRAGYPVQQRADLDVQRRFLFPGHPPGQRHH